MKVLSYHDVLLYQQDVDLLDGCHWLNDQVGHPFWHSMSLSKCHVADSAAVLSLQIIAFYFEYLQHETYAASDIRFCAPSVAFLISLGGEACGYPTCETAQLTYRC